MLPAVYAILLEAIVCGLMINRTLCSKSRDIFHFPAYIISKTVFGALAVYFDLIVAIVPVFVVISLTYTFLCFGDRLLRKLIVILACCFCLILSNFFKFSMLGYFDLTQRYNISRDTLASVICISLSMILFCALTIIATNIICKVKLRTLVSISSISFLIVILSAFIYSCMHSMIEVKLNGLFAVYALIFILPAIILLYFSEAVIFSSKEDYFS